MQRSLFFIFLPIMIGTLCCANQNITVNAASNPIPILLIYTTSTLDYPASVLNGVQGFGNTTIVSASDANKYYSLDMLRQYDLFVVESEHDYSDYRWSYYPTLESNIPALASEGKSVLAIIHGDSIDSSSPISGWGVSAYRFNVPSRTSPLQCEIEPSDMTQNITNITIPAYFTTAPLLLVGRYPLVRSPAVIGWPDPQADFAVYGYYDNVSWGKYVAISSDLFSAQGEVGVFFSNTLYWLTNKAIPPPPSVLELGNLIDALNQTLSDLNQRALSLNETFKMMDITQLNDTVNQLRGNLNQLNSTINQLDSTNSQLSNNITDLKDQIRTQQTMIYAGIIALIFSIIALIVAITSRPRQKAPLKNNVNIKTSEVR